MAGRKLFVLGAGCSGLAFAHAVADRLQADDELHIVDTRTNFTNDRTWCSWGIAEHPFAGLVKHRWSRCLLRAGGRDVVWSSEQYSYAILSGDDYYTAVLNRLSERPNVRFHLEETVRGVHCDGGGAQIDTDKGRHRADLVYDARGWDPDSAEARRNPPALLQHFHGCVVECEKEVFDPETAVLMDFDLPQDKGLCFMYLLPLSTRRALLEPTWMTKDGPFDDKVYRDAIKMYLKSKYDMMEYTVVHEETGCLPMDVRTAMTAEHCCIPLGIRGGLLKPSSGYGFAAMLRDAEAKAEAFALGKAPKIKPRSSFAHYMDKVFLSFMRRKPAEAPGVMLNLFERTQAEALARFLSDVPTTGDIFRVLWAMRDSPMPAEALHLLRTRK